MRVIFMGTPDFSVPTLEALVAAGHTVQAVVTQPDRPKGRGKKQAPPPVKESALRLNLPVWQPTQLLDEDFSASLHHCAPEVIVVVAYGRILPPPLLTLPTHGCINVHASLLPHYRGAAPIHRAVMNGEKITGVTTMFMNRGLDTGDMILKEELPISFTDTTGDIHDRLAIIGADLLVRTLTMLELGQAPRTPQTGPSSYASMLTKEDEQIRWEKLAQDIYNQIRGLNPWPGARTYWGEKTLKVWGARLPEKEYAQDPAQPGEIAGTIKDGLLIGTGSGLLVITELQLQGAKRMQAADFMRGTTVPQGMLLDAAPGKETTWK